MKSLIHLRNKITSILSESGYKPVGDIPFPVGEEHVVTIDYIDVIAHHTKTKPEEWTEADGPDSGVGVDYWFVHDDGTTCYVNYDQGHIVFELIDDTGDVFDSWDVEHEGR